VGERIVRKIVDAIMDRDHRKALKLLEKKPDLSGEAGVEALVMAIAVGDLEMVRQLLSHGADAKASEDEEPLICKAAGGSPSAATTEIVKALLAAGADPNARQEGTLQPALTLAVRAAAASSPAAQGEMLDAWASLGGMMTDFASSLGSDASALGEATADLQSIANQGPGPDQLAERTVVVDTLVQGGAHLEGTDGAGATALDMAVIEKDDALAAHLVALGAKDRRNDVALARAVNDGDLVQVQSLLTAGANPNRQFFRLGRPLNAAAQKGNLEIVRLLIAAGAEVDTPEAPDDGHTPLSEASYNGHLEVVRLLLDSGASPTRAAHGRRPLKWARDGRKSGSGSEAAWDALIKLLENRPEVEAARPMKEAKAPEIQAALDDILGAAGANLPRKGWKWGEMGGSRYLESPPLGEDVDVAPLVAAARGSNLSAVQVGWSIDDAAVGSVSARISDAEALRWVEARVLEWRSQEERSEDDDGILAQIAKDPLPARRPGPEGKEALFRHSPDRRLVLSTDPPERIALRWGFCQPNIGASAEELAGIFQSWRTRFGARLLAFDRSTATFEVETPLRDEATVRRAATEFTVVDPDIAEEASYLLQMAGASSWHFWWD